MMTREETKIFKQQYINDNEKFNKKIEELIKLKNSPVIQTNENKNIKTNFNILVVSHRITLS